MFCSLMFTTVKTKQKSLRFNIHHISSNFIERVSYSRLIVFTSTSQFHSSFHPARLSFSFAPPARPYK